jgi:hypothetical protein
MWTAAWAALTIGIGVVIAAGTGLAAGSATDPTAVETVFGCVHAGNGQIRAVSDPSQCGQDSAISWLARQGANVSLLPQIGDAIATGNASQVVPAFGLPASVAHLDLQPGSYLLLAKLVLDTGLDFPVVVNADCHLTAGSDSDDDRIAAESHTIVGAAVPTSLMLAHTFGAGGRADVTCSNRSQTLDGIPVDLTAANVKLTALAIGNLDNG